MTLADMEEKLRQSLSSKRYRHTLGVMYTAAALAMKYGEELTPIMTAGLLHDCGKAYPVEEQARFCEQYGLPLTEGEKQAPALLHAKLGAYLASTCYGVREQEVLDCIRYHTTGRIDMTVSEKIIYVADFIEPNRQEIEGLAKVRAAAFADLDRAVGLCAESTIAYLQGKQMYVDKQTIQVYQYYSKQGGDK